MNESGQIQLNNKPKVIIFFGVFNIILGGIGLFFSSMVIFKIIQNWQSPGAVMGYKIFLSVMNAIGFCFSIWLVILGAGLLAMRGWARRGSILYGWLGILFFIFETGVNLMAISFGWLKVPKEAMADFIAGMGISAIGGLVYPAMLLIFMKTRKVKEAFSAIGG